MTLADLIRGRSKNGPVGVATATPATVATERVKKTGTVARVATVAVANPGSEKTEAPLSPGAEARRQKVLAMLARDGGQYAVLVEDPNTDPVILALATPDGTCELLIPRDRYDPFTLLEMVAKWNREDGPRCVVTAGAGLPKAPPRTPLDEALPAGCEGQL